MRLCPRILMRGAVPVGFLLVLSLGMLVETHAFTVAPLALHNRNAFATRKPHLEQARNLDVKIRSCVPANLRMQEETEEVNRIVHFINLSNGLESLPMLQGTPVAFTRIQSSHCESGNFNGILGGLDPTLLLYLAQGYHCYLHDYGSRNKKRMAPRAIWYGVTFIKYALHKLWEVPGEPAKPILRGHNVAADFDHALRNLDKAVKKKVRYFKVYLQTDRIHLYGLVGATEIDGRRDLHAELASKWAGEEGTLVQHDRAAIERACAEGLKVFDTDVGFEWDPQQAGGGGE